MSSDEARACAELREFSAPPGEPAYPHVVVARLANSWLRSHRPYWEGASGKGRTLEAAVSSAVGEAIERYVAGSPLRSAVVAKMADLEGTVDPRRLAGLDASQALDAGFDPDREIAWVPAGSIRHPGAVRWLPASAVYMRSPDGVQNCMAAPSTSNGLAFAPTLEAAIVRAYAEIIERHLFFLVWYGAAEAERPDARDLVETEVPRVLSGFADWSFTQRCSDPSMESMSPR